MDKKLCNVFRLGMWPVYSNMLEIRSVRINNDDVVWLYVNVFQLFIHRFSSMEITDHNHN